jgi:hypothetical protein
MDMLFSPVYLPTGRLHILRLYLSHGRFIKVGNSSDERLA